jgi:PIN domain nuclease of toxin-antitoxin system
MRILPLIHRDPFDRIIIAQAITEDMVLITKDNIIPQYKEVEILW